MTPSDLSALLAPDEYRQARERLFASDGSFQWYVRRHKAALIDANALLMHAGRWWVHADKFDSFLLAAGAEAARQQLSAR
ncbi:MAG: hypothetical protein J0M00_06995 [Burkholderiales bacterium]|nr:hypothetical protein [Burkholderiales bacterium]